jgi:hypothetical protein
LEALLTSCLREDVKIAMVHFPDDALVYKDLLRTALTAASKVREPMLVTAPVAIVQHEEEQVVEPDLFFVQTNSEDEKTSPEFVAAPQSA